MRISTSMTFDNFLFYQQRLSGSLFSEQYRLTTGKEVSVPSDNPLQASRILKLTQTEETQQQILENIRFAGGFLNATDAALTEVTDMLRRAYELSSGAVGSLTIPEEREAAAIEIDSIINQLTSVANRQYLGMYLFGGRDVKQQPVEDELGGIHYLGDIGELRSKLAEDREEEFNLTADDAFIMLSDRIKSGIDLNPALTLDTRLDELKGANGIGIRPGSIRFDEGGDVGSFTVDLTDSTSIADVINKINTAAAEAGSGLVVSINADANGLLVTPGDEVTISEVGNGAVASDLGLIQNVPTGDPIVGLDLGRKLTPTTRLSDLFGGAGLSLNGSTMLIRNGDLNQSFDFGTSTTIQDIMNSINNSGLGVRAVINDEATGLNVLNEVSGTVMSIEEEGGNAATLLGLRTFDATTALADLNFADGVDNNEGEADFQIVAKNGSTIDVDIDGAETVQDVLDAINVAATTAGVAMTASLAATGNGIRIVDATGGAGALQINALNASDTVEHLGLDVTIDSAATEVIGTDVSGVRVDGVFGALLDLRAALTGGDEIGPTDEQAITEAAARMNELITHVAGIQGKLGAEVRGIEARASQTEEAVEATALLLGQVRDLDFTEAITKFQQTQTALQASLLAASQSLNVSLLNFLG